MRWLKVCDQERPPRDFDSVVIASVFNLGLLSQHSDVSEADQNRWRELKGYVVRMKEGLTLIETTWREERMCKIPLTAETGLTPEKHAQWGLGQ